MISFLAVGVVAGVMLGLRFRVLVLVPATVFVTAVVTAVGFAGGQHFRVIALAVLGTAALLQVGFVVGCVLEVAAPWRLAQKSGRMTIRYRPPNTERDLKSAEAVIQAGRTR